MAILLTTTIGPAGDFPLVEAKDVSMPDGTRLDEFLSGGSSEEVVLAEQTLDGFAYNDAFGAFHLWAEVAPYTLEDGKEYTVVWDGEEYPRTAFAFTFADGSECVGIGNKLAIGANDSGEPFCIVYDMTNSQLHYLSTEIDASHTVAIYRVTSTSGIGLPKVTEDDNNKILQVVDGEWEVVVLPDSSIDEETEKRIAAVEESTETALGGMLSLGVRLTTLETPADSVDLTNFETSGIIEETRADGTTVTYTMTFDDNGNPTKIVEVRKDADGQVVGEYETTMTW